MSGDAQQPRELTASEVLRDLDTGGEFDVSGPEEEGGGSRWLVRGLIALVILAAGAAVFAVLAQAVEGREGGKVLSHKVARGDLVVTITEDGNVESANNVNVKCEVSGGARSCGSLRTGPRWRRASCWPGWIHRRLRSR